MDAEHADSARLNELSGRVIGGAFNVQNTLGVGFLETVYETALAVELRIAGLGVTQQRGVRVEYKGVVIGEYVADPLVEDVLLVELKAVKALDAVHWMQCINYLKAAGLPLALLLNFGRSRLEVKRVVNGL